MQVSILNRKDFNSFISDSLSIYNENTVPEIEVRFKSYADHNEGYNKRIFNKILYKYNGLNFEKSTILINEDGLRKEIYDDKEVFTKKTKINSHFNKTYNLRFSVSSETEINTEIKNFKYNIKRERERYSYTFPSNNLRLDFTKVSENKNKKYEIELEVLNPRELQYEEFIDTIEQVLKSINDTYEVYTVEEKNTIINFYNRSVNSYERKNIIDHRQLVQARNLGFDDVVYGGLIGNQKTSYTVTVKADGERYQLIFHSSGLYLLRPPEEVILITRYNFDKIQGFVLDGELIPKDKRRKEEEKSVEYIYLAFDCISVPNKLSEYGNFEVQTKYNYGVRMRYAQAALDFLTKAEINQRILISYSKPFKSIVTPEDMFNVMDEMKIMEEMYAYDTDGFMFTPYSPPYNPHSEKLQIRDRVLTNFPDVCKLKPLELLTIDFLIKDRKAYSNDDGKLVLFEGNKQNPINQETDFDWDNKFMKKVTDETIVEFYWKKIKDVKENINVSKSAGGIFVPIRIRNDKEKPNSYKIAQANWRDISSGITTDIFTPGNMTLMRKYHNRIKRNLFIEAYQRVSSRTKKKKLNLLDLGSGAGGDISKWINKFNNVLAVDPNMDNLTEFRKRAKTIDPNNTMNITTFQAGSEDTDEITKVRETYFNGEKADVISAMLSLSFLWENPEKVRALFETIKQNISDKGTFIFFTINGDLINNTIKPPFKTGFDIGDRMTLGNIEFEFLTDTKYEITIPDSIVGTQVEYKVFLDDLTLLLNEIGMKKKQDDIADGERLLQHGHYEYSKLFSYGYYEK